MHLLFTIEHQTSPGHLGVLYAHRAQSDTDNQLPVGSDANTLPIIHILARLKANIQVFAQNVPLDSKLWIIP